MRDFHAKCMKVRSADGSKTINKILLMKDLKSLKKKK